MMQLICDFCVVELCLFSELTQTPEKQVALQLNWSKNEDTDLFLA